MACAMCHGTDVAEQCSQGQCYFDMQKEEFERAERARYERQEMERHFRENPHG